MHPGLPSPSCAAAVDRRLARKFAGDVEIDPPSGVDWGLGGGVGYNITRNWGVELQILGIDPDLRSAQTGTANFSGLLALLQPKAYLP